MALPNCRAGWEVKCVCLVEKKMGFDEHLALPLPHNIELNITKYLNLTLFEKDIWGELADRYKQQHRPSSLLLWEMNWCEMVSKTNKTKKNKLWPNGTILSN